MKVLSNSIDIPIIIAHEIVVWVFSLIYVINGKVFTNRNLHFTPILK